MKNRKLIISIMAGLLALVMVASLIIGLLPNAALAASSSAIKQQLDELKAQKAEIDNNIAQIEGQLATNMSEMEEIVAQKNLIDQEIFQLYQQEANINEQISAYGVLIADMQLQLDEAELKLEELNKKNKERIRAMEEGGNLSYWSVLFKANDFSDFLDRLNMVNEIAASDQRRLNEMSALAKQIADTKAQLEVELTALEQAKTELQENQKELEAKREEADRLLTELIALGAEYQAYLDEQEVIAHGLEGDINAAQDAYDDARNQEWLSTSVPTGGGGGPSNNVNGLTWLIPCNYTRFSSPFGERVHPVYGDVRFHYGVDLAAPAGTPIVATRSGVVTTATYSSSAGYYVAIDHQDGFSSKYLHMTHYIVSPGQYVNAGQLIGYVGSTGVSTGAHLHFSILYNGSHVNPAHYINI